MIGPFVKEETSSSRYRKENKMYADRSRFRHSAAAAIAEKFPKDGR